MFVKAMRLEITRLRYSYLPVLNLNGKPRLAAHPLVAKERVSVHTSTLDSMCPFTPINLQTPDYGFWL